VILPDPIVGTAPEAAPGAPESARAGISGPQAGIAPGATSEPRTDVASRATFEPQAAVAPCATSGPQTDAIPCAASDPQPGGAPGAASDPQPGVAPGAASEMGAGIAPCAASDPQPGGAPGATSEMGADIAPSAASAPQADIAPGATSEPRADIAPGGVSEPQADVAPSAPSDPRASGVALGAAAEPQASGAPVAQPQAFPASPLDRFLGLLACPACRGPLQSQADPPTLRCATCKQDFPILDGVPRFVRDPGPMREVGDSFGFQWSQYAAGAFETATIYGESEDAELAAFFQRMELTGAPGPEALAGLAVLDAGCGSGRLTANLARCGAQAVVGIDISRSVEFATRRVRGRTNVLIAHADIFHAPLRRGAFDIVWSEGVIHHTPDARAAFHHLSAMLRPDGRLYVWLYPPTFNAYRMVRDLLPFVRALPRRLQLAVCWLLAPPLWLAARLRGLFVPGGERSLRAIVFGLHDNLSPAYQSRHTVEELTDWFREAGFREVRPVGPDTGVVGRAPETPAAWAPAFAPAVPRRRRVLVITNAYPRADQPGRGVFIRSQVESLRREGLEMIVEIVPGYFGKHEYLKAMLRVRRRVRDGGFDLVHAHYGLSGVVALAQRRVPVVVSFMGDDVFGTPDRTGRYSFNSRLVAWLSRRVGDRAEAVIVKSDALKSALQRADAHVIPNGVDFGLFQPVPQDEARRRLGLDPTRRYVLFTGNPDLAVKDFSLASRAFDAFERAEPAAGLLVAARAPHEEMPLWYGAADVLLLTSRHEGSPNSVKEAMGCGLPVVTVEVGDVRTVLGDTEGCAVVPGRDPEALSRALLAATRPPRRTHGRERIEHLSLERVAARILAVYESVLDARAGSRTS